MLSASVVTSCFHKQVMRVGYAMLLMNSQIIELIHSLCYGKKCMRYFISPTM